MSGYEKYTDWFKPRKAQDVTRQYGEDCYNLGIKHTLDHIQIFIDAINQSDIKSLNSQQRLNWLIIKIKELRKS